MTSLPDTHTHTNNNYPPLAKGCGAAIKLFHQCSFGAATSVPEHLKVV